MAIPFASGAWLVLAVRSVLSRSEAALLGLARGEARGLVEREQDGEGAGAQAQVEDE